MPQARPGSSENRFSRRPEDPLAELARLIGQDDPFAEITAEQQQQRAPARSLATPVARRPVNGNGSSNGATHVYGRTATAPREERREDHHHEPYEAPAAENGYDHAPADPYGRQHSQEAAYEYNLPTRRAAAPVNGRAYSYGGGQALRTEPQQPQVARTPRQAPRVESEPEPQYEDYAAEPEQYGYQNGDAHDPYHDAYHDTRHDARTPEAPAQYQDDGYQQEYSEEYGSEYEAEYAADDYQYDQDYVEPQRGRRRWLLVAMSLIGIVGLGVAGIYGYRALFKHHRSAENPPTIRSAEAPTKVAPPAQATPEGAKQNYDRIGDQPPVGGERVISREEQPASFDANSNPGNRVVTPSPMNPAGQGSAVSAFAAPANQPMADLPNQPPAPAVVTGEPKRVRTLSVRADGSLVDNPPRRAQPASAPARNAPLSLNPNGDQLGDDADTQSAVAQPQTRNGRVAPAQTPQNANYIPAGSYVVQVSSQKSEADAQTAWRQLQAKYPNVLGNAQVNFKRVDLGDRGTFYRAMVGPFANRDQAYEMCQNLKSAGGECVVQRN